MSSGNVKIPDPLRVGTSGLKPENRVSLVQRSIVQDFLFSLFALIYIWWNYIGAKARSLGMDTWYFELCVYYRPRT